MKIFKELPIVLPFYDLIKNQDQYRENVHGMNQFKLISPKNALLPFQIEMPPDKESPLKWEIYRVGGAEIDITNNLSKIKVYNFTDKKQAVYKGEVLQFVYGLINEPLNLPCGSYYSKFTFPDETYYVSEVFTIPHNSFDVDGVSDFIKIEFWNDTDIEPILYRDDFRQCLYIDTFVSSFIPEVEEESDTDGMGNNIPTFQRMTLKYKFVEVVPDFIKIVLIALQMKDNVYIVINESRSGKIDRVEVTAQPAEGEGLNDVEVIFEDNILYKTNCDNNNQEQSVTTW